MPLVLAGLFFVTALLYASVGFGGGSTYNALLVLAGVDFRLVPLIALACNILVVSGNCWRYAAKGLLRIRPLMPAMIVSVPMAWIGGRLPISELTFSALLGGVLLVTGIIMLIPERRPTRAVLPWPRWILLPAGAVTGLLAGLVGIGGGIFLAPILYGMRWGLAREIAAACSLFILVNSLAGLAGQASKLTDFDLLEEAWPFAMLLPAVLVGGWIGNQIGLKRFSPGIIKQGTAVLILIVAVRLITRVVTTITG